MIVRVRANNNLPGLSAGQTTFVDTEVPFVDKCLRGGYITPIDEDGFEVILEKATPASDVFTGDVEQDEAAQGEETLPPAE